MRSAEFFIGTNNHKTEIILHIKYQVTRSAPDTASEKVCENKLLIILKLRALYVVPQIKVKLDWQY
jgi:hypothetical protein